MHLFIFVIQTAGLEMDTNRKNNNLHKNRCHWIKFSKKFTQAA